MQEKQSKTVYFIRHGETVDNASPVFQSINSPLNATGIAQAIKVADQFKTLEFELLISSPLLRAKQTATYISEQCHKEILFSDLFVERVKPDEIDGKPWDNEIACNIWRAWEESLYTPGMRISNGENYDDTITRVDKALEFLENCPETTIVVVTHGYFLRSVIVRALLGDNLNGAVMKNFQQRTSIQNSAVTILDYKAAFEEDFAWRLRSLNNGSL